MNVVIQERREKREVNVSIVMRTCIIIIYFILKVFSFYFPKIVWYIPVNIVLLIYNRCDSKLAKL